MPPSENNNSENPDKGNKSSDKLEKNKNSQDQSEVSRDDLEVSQRLFSLISPIRGSVKHVFATSIHEGAEDLELKKLDGKVFKYDEELSIEINEKENFDSLKTKFFHLAYPNAQLDLSHSLFVNECRLNYPISIDVSNEGEVDTHYFDYELLKIEGVSFDEERCFNGVIAFLNEIKNYEQYKNKKNLKFNLVLSKNERTVIDFKSDNKLKNICLAFTKHLLKGIRKMENKNSENTLKKSIYELYKFTDSFRDREEAPQIGDEPIETLIKKKPRYLLGEVLQEQKGLCRHLYLLGHILLFSLGIPSSLEIGGVKESEPGMTAAKLQEKNANPHAWLKIKKENLNKLGLNCNNDLFVDLSLWWNDEQVSFIQYRSSGGVYRVKNDQDLPFAVKQ